MFAAGVGIRTLSWKIIATSALLLGIGALAEKPCSFSEFDRSSWPPNVSQYQAFIDYYPITKFAGRLNCRGCGASFARTLPALLARFDWYLSAPLSGHRGQIGRCRPKDPQTVFVASDIVPAELHRLLAIADRDFDRTSRNRLLVIGGTDTLLSDALGRNRTEQTVMVSRLRKYFDRIRFEAEDRRVRGVSVQPRGLTERYFRNGVMETAIAAIASSGIDEVKKPRKVLAAWGKYFDMENIPKHYIPHMHPQTRVMLESRIWLREYVATDAAVLAGVEHRDIDPRSWFGELAQYRFMLSPLGNGIVSPKVIEALLVLTVPIVQRGVYETFYSMKNMGFPIVVVNDWAEVTAENLESWWTALGPRLESFRRNCLTSEGYWQMLTGDLRYCE